MYDELPVPAISSTAKLPTPPYVTTSQSSTPPLQEYLRLPKHHTLERHLETILSNQLLILHSVPPKFVFILKNPTKLLHSTQYEHARNHLTKEAIFAQGGRGGNPVFNHWYMIDRKSLRMAKSLQPPKTCEDGDGVLWQENERTLNQN